MGGDLASVKQAGGGQSIDPCAQCCNASGSSSSLVEPFRNRFADLRCRNAIFAGNNERVEWRRALEVTLGFDQQSRLRLTRFGRDTYGEDLVAATLTCSICGGKRRAGKSLRRPGQVRGRHLLQNHKANCLRAHEVAGLSSATAALVRAAGLITRHQLEL